MRTYSEYQTIKSINISDSPSTVGAFAIEHIFFLLKLQGKHIVNVVTNEI